MAREIVDYQKVVDCPIHNNQSDFPVNLQGFEKRPKHHGYYRPTEFQRQRLNTTNSSNTVTIELENPFIQTNKPSLVHFPIGVLTIKKGA